MFDYSFLKRQREVIFKKSGLFVFLEFFVPFICIYFFSKYAKSEEEEEEEEEEVEVDNN